jgi:L-ascorbate metabolism protein UlaG (beta-lactamase superfamily)
MSALSLLWLGQSGFLLRTQTDTLACDLYLSDYCQKKSKLDHTRKTSIPIPPEELEDISHYLITHAHADHFDPETVGPILQSQPYTQFYCPPDGKQIVDEHFPSWESRFTLLKTGHAYALTDTIRLIPLPAAHEELAKDENGEYISMSYLLLLDDMHKAVFFAGDTIPFDSQAERIRNLLPEAYALILVLPVNGRDFKRAELGFKGNLTVDEAIELYHSCNADFLVPCHFGMFNLNDIQHPLHRDYFEKYNVNVMIPKCNLEINMEV